jgi:hypothetical protein
MKYDIFISYSSKDQKIVEGLSAYLEQQGIRCFVAYRDISKGVIWAAAITEAIENCQCMVVVFSGNFNSSPQVDREIEMCAEEKKPIIPFKIQDAPLSGAKKYYLKNINWIDAFPDPEKCFGELYQAVRKLLPNMQLKPAEVQTTVLEPTVTQYFLKIRPNLDCIVFVDDERRIDAPTGKISKLPLNKGTYSLKFVSVENDADVYSLDYKMSDAEELLDVDLESIAEKREIEKERCEKERLEKLKLVPFKNDNGKYGFKDKNTRETLIIDFHVLLSP